MSRQPPPPEEERDVDGQRFETAYDPGYGEDEDGDHEQPSFPGVQMDAGEYEIRGPGQGSQPPRQLHHDAPRRQQAPPPPSAARASAAAHSTPTHFDMASSQGSQSSFEGRSHMAASMRDSTWQDSEYEISMRRPEERENVLHADQRDRYNNNSEYGGFIHENSRAVSSASAASREQRGSTRGAVSISPGGRRSGGRDRREGQLDPDWLVREEGNGNQQQARGVEGSRSAASNIAAGRVVAGGAPAPAGAYHRAIQRSLGIDGAANLRGSRDEAPEEKTPTQGHFMIDSASQEQFFENTPKLTHYRESEGDRGYSQASMSGSQHSSDGDGFPYAREIEEQATTNPLSDEYHSSGYNLQHPGSGRNYQYGGATSSRSRSPYDSPGGGGETMNYAGNSNQPNPITGAPWSFNFGNGGNFALRSPLLEHHGEEYSAVQNVDEFLVHLYKYYEAKGLNGRVADHLGHLVALGFTIAFSFVLVFYVDWPAILSCKYSFSR
eukprot:g12758.t1